MSKSFFSFPSLSYNVKLEEAVAVAVSSRASRSVRNNKWQKIKKIVYFSLNYFDVACNFNDDNEALSLFIFLRGVNEEFLFSVAKVKFDTEFNGNSFFNNSDIHHQRQLRKISITRV